jgi:prephenate dehydratase
MIQPEENTIAGDSEAGLPLKVAIQGYRGAFHDLAARHSFKGRELDIVPAHTFDELIQKVEKQEEADVGLMAIENTLAGSILFNYQLLNDSQLTITGEVFLRIKQNLMALPGQQISDLQEVHSHPMALAQCKAFFAQYPSIKLVESADTALSARQIRENNLAGIGAVASTLAAQIYELNLLAEGVETNKNNHTRFLILERKMVNDQVGESKISLSFSVEHEVGSLYKVLSVLAAYNVNMTKIQSMPIIGQPWEYQFFLDFVIEEGRSYQQVVDAIRPITHALKVIGVYQKGQHIDL